MRKYYIDRIRTVTIILVVVYHIIYMFNSVVTEGGDRADYAGKGIERHTIPAVSMVYGDPVFAKRHVL